MKKLARLTGFVVVLGVSGCSSSGSDAANDSAGGFTTSAGTTGNAGSLTTTAGGTGSNAGGASGAATAGGASSGGATVGGAVAGGSANGGNANGGASGGSADGGSVNGGSASGGSVNGGSGGVPATPAKFVGSTTTQGAVRADFLTYWHQLTPENETKWASIEAMRDQMVWTQADAAHDFAKQHGIPFKFHTFVWGSQFPSWMTGLSAADQLAEVEEWIQAACTHFPDLQLIDVVNEPDHTTPPFSAALGGNTNGNYQWVVWSFKTARKYCPNATLILNDYNVLRYDTDNYINIVKKAVAGGAPIDALGAQAHGLETQQLSELKANLAKVLAVGLPLYITEYDIDQADDAQQKAIISAQFPIFWSEPQIKGITFWGYVYGQTWKPNTGLLKDTTPRPALSWLMDYVK